MACSTPSPRPRASEVNETEAITRLRRIATNPAARGLLDDAALLEGLVITHDSIAEGVHYLPGDPPESVGWKLAAVNASDLAAKGAKPLAALLSLSLTGDDEWDLRFLDGLEAALAEFDMDLVGGDTIALGNKSPRVLGLTAIGRAAPKTPSRAGGCEGDLLWLVGTLGDSAAGLARLLSDSDAQGPLVEAYRRPQPLLAAGAVLAAHATAMMDVSDGLLLDVTRLAGASGVSAQIDLTNLPLSDAFIAERGDDVDARLFAATGGDDYALLLSLSDGLDPFTLSLPGKITITAIGRLGRGSGISLTSSGEPVPLPERLGHEHCPV
ncbi:MAG: thiamine-phosphate kinase [Sphingomicrobium sp.]